MYVFLLPKITVGPGILEVAAPTCESLTCSSMSILDKERNAVCKTLRVTLCKCFLAQLFRAATRQVKYRNNDSSFVLNASAKKYSLNSLNSSQWRDTCRCCLKRTMTCRLRLSLEVAVIQNCSKATALTCVPPTRFSRSPSNHHASASAFHSL